MVLVKKNKGKKKDDNNLNDNTVGSQTKRKKQEWLFALGYR